MIKLLAIDLDRTTLDSTDTVPASAMAALRQAIDAGVTVAIATGRNVLGIPKVLRELPGIRYAITSNGAAIFDLETLEPVFEKTIPLEQAVSLLERAGELGIPRGTRSSTTMTRASLPRISRLTCASAGRTWRSCIFSICASTTAGLSTIC